MAEPERRDFGPYVLEKLISGEGGQGLVYLATHKALEKRVVIKILKDHLAKHDSFVERFAFEASQLARMDHANIVRVRQTGPMGDAYFIEMEYIEGWDLTTWLREHGRLPVEVAVLVLQRFAAGLEHAHERAIIHRDVKPGNVMLTASGQVKVLDFGLARDLDDGGRSTPGTLMGTVAYMSPEQVDGKEATPAFDVYSLGVVAYQLLSNRVPFEGTIASVCMKIKNEEPVPLEKLCPEVPAAFLKLVRRMMAKQPAQRPRDMREVDESLLDLARELGLRAGGDLLQRYVADPEGTAADLARRRTRRRYQPWVMAGAAVVAVVALVFALAQWRMRAAPPAAPGPAADTAAVGGPAPAVPEPGPALPESTLAERAAAAAAAAARDSARAARDSARAAARDSARAAARAAALAVAAPAGTTSTAPAPGGVTSPAPGGTLATATEPVPTAWSADSLVVDVTVKPDADLYLDGVRVASRVSHWSRRLVRKPWTVRVDAGEYGAREQKRKARAQDALLAFRFDLTSGQGGLYIHGPRNGLDIYVDNVFQRVVTPSPVRPLSVGPHVVEVRDHGTGQVLGSRRIVVQEGPNNVDVDFTSGR